MLGGGPTGSFSKSIRDRGLILSGCNVIGWSYVINILPRFGYVGGGHSGLEFETYYIFLNV